MSNTPETTKPAAEAARTDATIPAKPAPVPSPIPGLNMSEFEKQIDAVLAKRAADRKEAAQPKEPDWSTLSEKEAMSTAIYIPMIEHDVPDYMNMMLKDTEYECVWASKDQRRLGQLVAEGYEFLKLEHVHPQFKVPLVFGSDGTYCYSDVICMRVHKRILYGKRRKALQVSLNQLANRNRPPRVRVKDTFDLVEPVGAGQSSSYYDAL